MKRSERLLLNVLPPEIAERLKRQEYPIADRFDDVSVLFADMVGFTERSAAEAPDVTVAVLNEFLGAFDALAQQHGLRPIRITGDSYLVVGGLPVPRPDHAQAIADMALDMLDRIARAEPATWMGRRLSYRTQQRPGHGSRCRPSPIHLRRLERYRQHRQP